MIRTALRENIAIQFEFSVSIVLTMHIALTLRHRFVQYGVNAACVLLMQTVRLKDPLARTRMAVVFV